MEIRQASMEDILRWYDQTGQEYPGWSMRAFTAEHDGKLMGLAGVYYQGKGNLPVAFSEMLPEMKNHKKVIVKATRMVMDMIKSRNAMVIALCNTDSGKIFCEKLGFFPARHEEGKGSVMIWQPQFRI